MSEWILKYGMVFIAGVLTDKFWTAVIKPYGLRAIKWAWSKVRK